ncbi:uncharacterized protein LOC143571674 [Bidens hawaiensis]|uniref:uncharacterized protein LOC143571674 n=1 Tax=Bidens hawaiensis TaxID=980011 RepID=UPI00404AD3E1
MVSFTRIQPSPALLVRPHSQQLWPPAFPPTASFIIKPPRIIPRRIHAKNRRWDSNAESFRSRNYDFDSDEDFEDVEDTNQWLDVLEDFIDGVWIFKAFKSYGWMLPAIISSLLITSGPKAFLMALAIPMGQSALSLLFQTVWGKPRYKKRRQTKSKPKRPSSQQPRPPPRAASYMDIEDEQEEYVKSKRKRATAYQTWVAGDSKSNGSSSSFGGWEELDGRNDWSKKDGKPRKSMSKMGRGERRSEMPLLLRLLIAVFPFLGSWTRML